MKKIITLIIVLGIVGFYLVSIKETTDPVVETTTAHIVTYTDAGYTPNTLTVKAGETVTFKNTSQKAMWTASAKHPTHGNYPTTGGCLGSTFDACKGVQPGDVWAFQFNATGTWPYHDHLTPNLYGKIIVE